MSSSSYQPNHVALFGTVLGSLIMGLPLMPSAAVAQLPDQPPAANTILIPSTGETVEISQIRVATIPPAPQNPCPSIYYESPHDQHVVVPSVCKPNLITQELDKAGLLEQFRASAGANAVTTPGGKPYTTTPNTSY